MHYDLIGDVHGHARPLTELLEKLGYRASDGVYRHPQRQAIFLGDFIDRGPDQRRVIAIVRRMIDNGFALAVMGNHEYSAISYVTTHPAEPTRYLRTHSDKHRRQHRAFLEAYEGEADYPELIEWFRTLPLWLELPGLRVVHACWDDAAIRFLKSRYRQVTAYLADDLLVRAACAGTPEFRAVETLLKGKEVKLPAGREFVDRDGIARDHIRVRWFDASARSYREAFLGPESGRRDVLPGPIDPAELAPYPEDAPPVFFAHYWLDTTPALMAPKVACLDYSIASDEGGKLVAYRWDGEQNLDARKFVYVERKPCAGPQVHGRPAIGVHSS